MEDPPPCTVGFLPPSSWRSPADTTEMDTPDGLYCKLPQDSPSSVRGARNYPCMGQPGKRAPTVEICNSDKPYEPLAMRQHVLGPYPLDPNLISQGIPPDQRINLGERILAPSREHHCRPDHRCRPADRGRPRHRLPTIRPPLPVRLPHPGMEPVEVFSLGRSERVQRQGVSSACRSRCCDDPQTGHYLLLMAGSYQQSDLVARGGRSRGRTRRCPLRAARRVDTHAIVCRGDVVVSGYRHNPA